MFRIFLTACLSFLITCPLFCQEVSPCLHAAGLVGISCPKGVDASVDDAWCAGIARQIARSFNAEGLSSWITPGRCWGWIGTEGGRYEEQAIPPDLTPVNCTPPYDRCYGNYCPEKYCSVIKAMTGLKASIILRAVNTWGRDDVLRPGTAFYRGMQQLVIDINAAYDCQGLQRPVIQGTILEHIEKGVNVVPIPVAIIMACRNEKGFEKKYYLDAGGNARTDLHFDFDRIRNKKRKLPLADCPDITRIEARMWFYYLARMYIDMGYKSIHMGQLNEWGRLDQPRYKHTATVLAAIRAYARSRHTFVLLTQENFRALKYPGTDTFMFDYDSRALRIREVTGPEVCGDFNCNTVPVDYLSHTPCAGEGFPAVIDSCVLCAQGNSGGYQPVYGTYTPFQPYNTYFDFGPGNHPDTGKASSGCDPNPQWGTWGWDDTKWFAQKIGAPCRAFWISDAIGRLRQYHNGFGFMTAPGLLLIPMPENGDRYLSGHNPTAGASYLLADEDPVMRAVAAQWSPANEAMIFIERVGDEIPEKKSYTFRVQGADHTTLYTWHIQNPDGSWQPHAYGLARSFEPTADGTYTIYLRQDNLGGYADRSTTKVISCKIKLGRQDNHSLPAPLQDPIQTAYPAGSIPYEANKDMSAYDRYVKDRADTTPK
ncbi:hypothetical protein [Taibaiella koreensis]|uniref:hypothetical protein n=1 Tax=Taibaiella koreensis TaxID=1268548 RepID=UPI000E5A0D21|nr:hypothetical protein [Taibaiella koreensis]